MSINLAECCRDGGCAECGKYSHCSHHCPVSEGLKEFTIEEHESTTTRYRVYAPDKESARQKFGDEGGDYLSETYDLIEDSITVYAETSD